MGKEYELDGVELIIQKLGARVWTLPPNKTQMNWKKELSTNKAWKNFRKK